MSLGQVETIFMCSSQDSGLGQGACPPGLYLKTQQAFILLPSSEDHFNQQLQPFDYSLASSFFAVAFSSVVILYLVSKMSGTILEAIKKF